MKFSSILPVVFLSLCFNAIPVFAQQYRTVQKVVPLHNEHTFYLNSSMSLGGKPRHAVRIDLPPNTVEWYYVFTTAENERSSGARDKIQLAGQLVQFVGKGLLKSSVVGMAASVVGQIVKPSGVAVCDVWLTDLEGRNQFFETKYMGAAWTYDRPKRYYEEGSVQNGKDGAIRIDAVKSGTLYLCFNNSALTEGAFVNFEAAAIVETREYIDEWASGGKEEVFQDCMAEFVRKDEAAENVCHCTRDRIAGEYRPSVWKGLSPSEKNYRLQSVRQQCLNESGYADKSNAKARARAIEAEINGLNAIKDYKGLAQKYQELLSLAETEEENFYWASWFLLLSKQNEVARKVLYEGLGKYPESTALNKNLAHYWLLTGRFKEAEPVYLRYADKKIFRKWQFNEYVLSDIEWLESAGILIPEKEAVLKLLKE
ncbi:MAG: hypothetical protein HUU01_00275 [Saprospiraceae bacterium]|nr:hypothetical protein [Saprospiraceae bacterium]